MTKRTFFHFAATVTSIAIGTGCTGAISGEHLSEWKGGQGGSIDVPVDSNGNPVNPDPQAPGCDPKTKINCVTEVSIPGPRALRRLSNSEFGATVGALITPIPDLQAGFPPDGRPLGFDNHIASASISLPHLEQYLKAAQNIAEFAMSQQALRTKLFGSCDVNTDTCLQQAIARLGRQFFRRSLRDDEKASLMKLANAAKSDANTNMRAQLVMQGLLMSPQFLYRVEYGETDPADAKRLRLTGAELASKLAFTLWGRGPDDSGIDAGEKGSLGTAAGIEAETRRLLADPNATRGLHQFLSQWLHMHQLADVRRAPEQYAAWSETVRASLYDETRRFIADISAQGADLRDLLTSTSAHINADNAPLYGVTSAAGWTRVALPASAERAGILTQPGVLMMTAREPKVTPILRGKFVRDVLLCDEPPSPPANVDTSIPDPGPGQSVRDVLKIHQENPSCAGCHNLMDPVGFGFERYDVMGRLVTKDSGGRPLTGEGRLEGSDDPNFTGAPELARKIADSPDFSRCVATHLLRYAQGRGVDEGEMPAVDQLGAELDENGHDLHDMIVTLTKQDVFYRVSSN